MEINRAAIGALAVVGVVAAGSGAYLATRQADDTSMSTVRESSAPAVPGSVNETENSIAPAPAAPAENMPAPANTYAPAARPSAPPPVANARREPAPSRAQAPVASARPERSRPASQSGASGSAAPNTPSDPGVNAAVEPVENTTVERAPYVAPVPQKQYEELVVPADAVIGLQIDNAITSERAKVEDQVHARVTRDVKV